MGPAVRAAAADARRQILELAAQRYDADAEALALADGVDRPRRTASAQPLDRARRAARQRPDPRLAAPAARTRPGCSVLTFGVQVAEVAVDVETGEVTVERVAAIHDVGRVINPLGASSQIEGGIIQGIGHTLSEERLTDPATGAILTRTLDAYRMPTIADVPEIVGELIDIPDAQLTNLGSKGIGEPPIIPVAAAIANAIRDATGADIRSLPITREEMLRRPRRGRGQQASARPEPVRAVSVDDRAPARAPGEPRRARGRAGTVLLAGGTEVVPQLRDGLLEADDARRHRRARPARRSPATTDRRRRRRSPSSRRAPTVPEALREACRLAASPQLRNMGTVGGNLLQSTRCWYWRLDYPCRLHGGDRCHARDGEHREHAIFANDFCASAHPSDVGGRAARARRDRAHEPARAAARASSTGCPTPATGALTALEPGEVLLELDVPPRRRVGLPEGDGPQALRSFPLVGVAAVRRGGATTRRARRRRAGAVAARGRRSTRRRRCPGTRTRSRSRRRSLTRALATIAAA